ncbi:MAG: hypothetical protein SVW77_01475, partial [Candidatus Nanohaloarchaea archaeon]|nr:hypothetical protein [Candidatus Nanohaloarchaea archaeon]
SPILATTVMVLITVGMAVGTYTVVTQQRGEVEQEAQTASLATVNATCMPTEVTWWINNTGEQAIQSPQADLLVFDDGVNASLSRQNVPLPVTVAEPGAAGKLTVALPKKMALGEQYGIELTFDDTTIHSTCRTGGQWWDASWRFRRALLLDTAADVTAQVTLDAEPLINNGTLRSDCADLRAVKNQDVAPYRVVNCNPSGTARLRINLSGTTPGETYVYYGNLQAGSSGQPLVNEGVVPATLGPEERVNLP